MSTSKDINMSENDRKEVSLSENEAFTEEGRNKPSKYRLLLCPKDHSDLSTIRTEVENLYNEFCRASHEDFHRKYPLMKEVVMKRFIDLHERITYLQSKGVCKNDS